MTNGANTKQLVLEASLNELPRLTTFLESIEEEWQWNPSLTFSLNLVLEEAVTNTISYGYAHAAGKTIELTFVLSGNELLITIRDEGVAYDPTRHSDPDISLPAEDRPIGGLGILLIKKLMDSVSYKREGGFNHLILTKRIDS
ncbi:MAG: ATP-binding protein [Bacteroidales bacterium]